MSLWSEGRIHSAWCPNTNNQDTVGEKEGLGLSEVTLNSLRDERRNKDKAHRCSCLCKKRCMPCLNTHLRGAHLSMDTHTHTRVDRDYF